MSAQAIILATAPRRRRTGFVSQSIALPERANSQAMLLVLPEQARAQFRGFGQTDDEVLRIGSDPATATELRNRIRSAGGAIIINASESHGALSTAYDHSFQFGVEQLTDGRYRITERDWTKYAVFAALGFGVLMLVRAARD